MHHSQKSTPLAVLPRRDFLATAGLAVASALTSTGRVFAATPAARRVLVGGHPWVYAATQPGYDLTPVLPQIFADLSAAGLDGIELMHTALRPDDAIERIGALSRQHKLPLIGSSFSGAMWDRAQHAAIAELAALVILRLAKLGGRTLGLSVGALKGGQRDAVRDDLAAVTALCRAHHVVSKVIFETCLLTREEKILACQLCIETGAHFVKTSTGFSTGGATAEDLRLMSAQVKAAGLGVKASGGIRTLADALAMLDAGATRLGVSAGLKILAEARAAAA